MCNGRVDNNDMTHISGLPLVTVGTIAYNVIYGNRITLQCSVISDPAAYLIYWQKEVKGVFSTLSRNAFGTNGMTPNNPSLTIESATLFDSGAYLCSAVNTVGISSSEWITVSVTGGAVITF